MRKVIEFGKVDFYRNGRKNNPVTVEIELKTDDEGRKEFTACGYIYTPTRKGCLAGGQCLDTIKEYLGDDELFNEVYRLWKLYHLNGLHAGTEAQEKALEAKFGGVNANIYDEQCKYLASIGLFEDKNYLHNGKPYKFGHAWLFREIPEEDLKKIVEILKKA